MATLLEWISIPLGYVMRFCSWLCGGQYLLALLLFAFLVKVILFPFGIKGQKNQIKQAKLRPKEMAIRNKYKGRTDRATQEKMNAELQDLYAREKFNPASGCLPLLIQMPILFSLYAIIVNPLRYICQFTVAEVEAICETVSRIVNYGSAADAARMPAIQALRYLTTEGGVENVIRSLPVDGTLPTGASASSFADFTAGIAEKLSTTTLPNFRLFGVFDLSVVPSDNLLSIYLIIPILTFVVVFFTLKLQRKFTYMPPQPEGAPTGCSNNVMDFTMPALSTYIAFITCGAIGIYWIFQNVLGFLQQVILSKMFPIPQMTPEEIKAAEKAAQKAEAEARKAAKANKSANRPRSLHHIDDDDYEPTPKKTETKSSPEEDDDAPKSEPKNESTGGGAKGLTIGKAKLKDDEEE